MVRIFFTIAALGIFSLQAASPGAIRKRESGAACSFTENKGQIYDQYRVLRKDILFSGSVNNLTFHLKNNGIIYQLSKIITWKEDELSERRMPEQVALHRVEINWINCEKNPGLLTEGILPGYNNYYSETHPDGLMHVRSFKEVTYKNIYKNIDLHYYEKNGGLKYDYIVAPGANYKQIKLGVSGAESISIQSDGHLLIKTSLGSIIEEAPIAYQKNKRLKAKWIIAGNVIGFEIPGYDPGSTLVIDPVVRAWGTYYGGAGQETSDNCYSDSDGNAVMTGFTGSTSNIATSGAYQTTISTGFDAYVVKFNPSGVRKWATYYGSGSSDRGWGCCIDAFGNVFLTGDTDSPGSTLATAGSQQTVSTGQFDAFLVKFDSTGSRQWATYYGGTGNETANSCIADRSGNVYMAGLTNVSTGNFISTLGAHQPAVGGGTDAFLVKFSPSGTRLWGTYYGGSSTDVAWACTVDRQCNVYMTGYTGSSGATSTAIATPGSHQSAWAGGNSSDCFLVKFDSLGVRQWGTYYGASPLEYGRDCGVDSTGNVYLIGTVYSSLNTGTSIATTGSYQQAGQGGTEAFLVKFNSAGVRQWGTYFGGTGNDLCFAGCTDALGNTYISGSTNSQGIGTLGAHQSISGGGTDAYLAKFNTSGNREWSTYYGGTGSDDSYGCYADRHNNVYLAGNTSSSTGTVIATPGSYQNTHGGGAEAFLAKLGCSPVSLSILASNNPLCSGNTLSLSATLSNITFTNYSWSGPNSFTSAVLNPTVSNIGSAIAGNYFLTVSDGLGCYQQSQITISVGLNPTISIAVNPTVICRGANNSATIFAGGALSYTWSSGNTGASVTVAPSVTTSYSVAGTNSAGCVGSNSTTIYVSGSPLAVISVTNGCENTCEGKVSITASAGIQPYTYSITGSTCTLSSCANLCPGLYHLFVTDSIGCMSSSFFSIASSKCVGIQELNATDINIYPNPTEGVIMIDNLKEAEVNISNGIGQDVFSKTLKDGKTRIDLSQLPDGIYFLSLKNNSGSGTKKIIKQQVH